MLPIPGFKEDEMDPGRTKRSDSDVGPNGNIIMETTE
jgi:hypothetical protein